MARTNILPVHWGLIKTNFENGTCVPILGPSVNAAYDGYTGFLPNHEIAFTLLNELFDLSQADRDKLAQVALQGTLQPFKDLTRRGMDDLARVALHYQHTSGPDYLVKRLRELRNDMDQEPSKLLKLIASQPINLIATANYDRLMEKALNQKCMVVSQPDIDQGTITHNVLQESLFSQSRPKDGPILYKFCGSYADGSKLPAQQVAGGERGTSITGEQREFLHNNIDSSISKSDFEDIIFFFGITYDNLQGERLRDKMRDLILELERQQRIPILITKLKEKRPQVKWDIFKEAPGQQVSDSGNQSSSMTTLSERVVVTEEDFLEILTNVGSREARRIPQQLQAKLNHSSLLLFLGFRLEGWEFRTIFKTLVEHQDAKSGRKLIAIQKDPSDFWVEFWKKKGVDECYDMDPASFAQQLETRMLNDDG